MTACEPSPDGDKNPSESIEPRTHFELYNPKFEGRWTGSVVGDTADGLVLVEIESEFGVYRADLEPAAARELARSIIEAAESCEES